MSALMRWLCALTFHRASLRVVVSSENAYRGWLVRAYCGRCDAMIATLVKGTS